MLPIKLDLQPVFDSNLTAMPVDIGRFPWTSDWLRKAYLLLSGRQWTSTALGLPDLKTALGASPSWVRSPLPPPTSFATADIAANDHVRAYGARHHAASDHMRAFGGTADQDGGRLLVRTPIRAHRMTGRWRA